MITTASPIARTVGVLLLAAMAWARQAHAQRDEQVGSVRVHLETDSARGENLSYAMLRPEGNPREGSLVWACGGHPNGFIAAIHIPDVPVGRNARVVWRFDGENADSADLFVFTETTAALFGTPSGAPLIGRAQTAARLAVLLNLDVPGRAPMEYVYALSGVDSAMKRLGCGPGTERSGVPAGLATLRGLISTPGATHPLAVIQAVQVVNLEEVQQRFSRSLPPSEGERVQGRIVVRLLVVEDGTVDASSIRVTDSTHPELNALAIQALQTARFRPTTADGRPVESWAALPLDFTAAPAVRPSP